MISSLSSFVQNPGGKILVPNSFVEEKKIESQSAQTTSDISEQAPITETAETPAPAAPNDSSVIETPVKEDQAPTQLSTLMMTIARTYGKEGLEVLLEKFQSVDIAETRTLNDSQLCGTLNDLLKVAKNPEKLKEAIDNLEPVFYADLKAACSNNGEEDKLAEYASLAEALLMHGSVVGAYVNAAQDVRDHVSGKLDLMKDKANVVSSDSEEYAKTLGQFKTDLLSLIKNHEKARKEADNYGSAQVVFLKKADSSFKNDLIALTAKYSSKIDKADLVRLNTDLKAAREQVENDPKAANVLNQWMSKIFTQEGAIGLAMFVPFLASILSGTLGELPLVGHLIKSMCGLSAGVADMAQKLIQTMSIVNQAKTSQQVAALQSKPAPPPAASKNLYPQTA